LSIGRTVLVSITLPLGYVVGAITLWLPFFIGTLTVSASLLVWHLRDRSAQLPVTLAAAWIVLLNGYTFFLLGCCR